MKTLLLILDGAGLAAPCRGNAITSHTMPFLFQLMKDHGYAVLDASVRRLVSITAWWAILKLVTSRSGPDVRFYPR
jgi:hypothetical protein